MKYLRTIVTTTFFSYMLLAGSVSYAAAQDGCSSQSLKGGYGFTVTGTNTEFNLQFAISGRFVSDGNGHFTGKATQSVSGSVNHTDFNGAYVVNPDCSGTALFQFQSGATAKLDFVLANDGNDVYIIDADNGTIETGTAKKQFVK